MKASNEEATDLWVKVNGETVELAGITRAEQKFLSRVRAAAQDPAIDETEIDSLVWGVENPVLTIHPETGSPVVDREAFARPAFQVMLDLVDQKRVLLGSLDPAAAAARYTMRVREAADKLGIHTATVRHAIKSKRLAAWKKGATYYLDPASVDSYKVSTRGARAETQFSQGPRVAVQFSSGERTDRPPGAIWYREGTVGDFFLRIKGALLSDTRGTKPTDPIKAGMVPPPWKRLAVQTGKKGENKYRFFILEPEIQQGGRDKVLSFAGFHVRGDFRVVEKVNNPREALEKWKAF